MKRISFLIFSFLFLLVAVVSVFAQSVNSNIPERNGDYPDPVHPGIRVRVFVHEPARGGKPSPTPVPAQCLNPSSTTVDGTTGWKLPTSVDYYVNESSLPASVSTSFQNMAGSAFAEWTGQITSGAPSVNFAGSTSINRNAYDGANVITFGRTQGSALAVTYTRYNTSTHMVVDVDTIMNIKFAWASGCASNSYDVSNILTHELGHWYGLDDSYDLSYSNNTMYGYGSKAETKKITPEQGDKDGINQIYP